MCLSVCLVLYRNPYVLFFICFCVTSIQRDAIKTWLALCCASLVCVCVCEHKNDSMVEYRLIVGVAVSALSKLQPDILVIFGRTGTKQKRENITLNIVIKHYLMHCVGELAESCEKLNCLFMTWLSTANCYDCLKACKGISWSTAWSAKNKRAGRHFIMFSLAVENLCSLKQIYIYMYISLVR